MDPKITGKIIAELRKEKGWTQLVLSEKLFVSDRTISKWESGQGYPDITQLPALSKLFDVSIDYLLTGQKSNNLPLIERLEECAINDDLILFDTLKENNLVNKKDKKGNTLKDYVKVHKSMKLFDAMLEYNELSIDNPKKHKAFKKSAELLDTSSNIFNITANKSKTLYVSTGSMLLAIVALFLMFIPIINLYNYYHISLISIITGKTYGAIKFISITLLTFTIWQIVNSMLLINLNHKTQLNTKRILNNITIYVNIFAVLFSLIISFYLPINAVSSMLIILNLGQIILNYLLVIKERPKMFDGNKIASKKSYIASIVLLLISILIIFIIFIAGNNDVIISSSAFVLILFILLFINLLSVYLALKFKTYYKSLKIFDLVLIPIMLILSLLSAISNPEMLLATLVLLPLAVIKVSIYFKNKKLQKEDNQNNINNDNHPDNISKEN